jgi:hypothetical protein
MGSMHRLLPVAVLGCLLCAAAAVAGRALLEPPGLQKVVKGAPRADVDRALSAAGLAEVCGDALFAPDLHGARCRATVAAALAAQRPLHSVADVDARAALLKDLFAFADEVHAYQPLNPPAGFLRLRYDALREIAAAGISHHDALAALPADAPGRARAAAVVATVREGACKAAQQALELSSFADAAPEERASLQTLLVHRRCFLDESRLASAPRPAALEKNEQAQEIKASASDEGLLRDYAQTRALELERCKKHLDIGGNPRDPDKLGGCLCDVVKRWRFPARPTKTTTTLSLSELAAALPVVVESNGAVAACGPLP